MVRGLAWGMAAALALMGCELPEPGFQVAVSPMYDQMWTQQRRLCLAAPQGDHCDVYLRNETPPAPYATDGILIQQRRLCFESPSVANCTLAQQMGREAAQQATRGTPSVGQQAQAPDADDDDEVYSPTPVTTTDAAPAVATESLPAPAARRAVRRAAGVEGSAQCSADALASLDLVEPRRRVAILRRCNSAQR